MNVKNHILVVGDHQLQEALRADPCNNGTMISVASNLNDARGFIEHRKVDLVVADLDLPDGTGAEILNIDGRSESCQILILGEDSSMPDADGQVSTIEYLIKSDKTLRELPRTVESRVSNWRGALAREQSSQHQEHLVAIWDATPDFVGTTDVDGFFLHLNSQGRRMLGLDESEDVSHIRMFELYDKDNAARLIATGIPQAVKNGVWRSESTLVFKSGESVPVSQVLIAHKDMQGNVTHFSSILHDLTEVRASESERERLTGDLHQAMKMESIGRLAGGVAHNLNNQLTAIIGYAELGLIEAMSERSCKNELEMVIESCEHASELIGQLVSFSRKQAVDPCLLNINDVVNDNSQMIAGLLGSGVSLETDLDPGLWSVIIDRSQLEQIIVNLATNDRDRISSQGRILINTWNTALDVQQVGELGIETAGDPQSSEGELIDLVVFSVSDSGPRMDEETRRHIFEPFYSSSSDGRSRGLGLSSVYGAVAQNKGAILVRESECGGNRFDVYLRRATGNSD
jgi:PAS domain S-box-containing protein